MIFWPQKFIFEVFWCHFWVICSFVPVSINASLHHCKGLKMQKCGFECVWQVAIYSRMIFWHKIKNWFFDLKNRFSKIFEVTFDSFWMPRLRKCSSSATSQVSKNFLRHEIKNPFPRICQKCSEDHFGMSHVAIGSKLTSGFAKNQKISKRFNWVPFWNNRLHVLIKIVESCFEKTSKNDSFQEATKP